jgi:hypothetical protein
MVWLHCYSSRRPSRKKSPSMAFRLCFFAFGRGGLSYLVAEVLLYGFVGVGECVSRLPDLR